MKLEKPVARELPIFSKLIDDLTFPTDFPDSVSAARQELTTMATELDEILKILVPDGMCRAILIDGDNAAYIPTYFKDGVFHDSVAIYVSGVLVIPDIAAYNCDYNTVQGTRQFLSDNLLQVLTKAPQKIYLQGPSDDAEGMAWMMLYAILHNKHFKGSGGLENCARKDFTRENRKALIADLEFANPYDLGVFIRKSSSVLAQYTNSTRKKSKYWSRVLMELAALQELDHLLERDDLQDFKHIQNLRGIRNEGSLVDCRTDFGDLTIWNALDEVKSLDEFELLVIKALVLRGDAAVKKFMNLTDIETFKEFKTLKPKEYAKLKETKAFKEIKHSGITNTGKNSPSVKFRVLFEFHKAAIGALLDYSRILRGLLDDLSG